MIYTKTSHEIQKLPTGGIHAIHAYTFIGTSDGPNIYLQANLHGSEVLGTQVLASCIQYLESRDDVPGSITIVPCANPLAVQSVQYNGIAGRWNPHTGTNWNRIFQTEKSTKAEALAAAEQTINGIVSSEQKLAAVLTKLSHAAEYCIDLHTSGASTIPHIFRNKSDDGVFDALGAPVHLGWSAEDCYGAFDESHVSLFSAEDSHTYACTWEVHHHNDIDARVVAERAAQLIHWLEELWCESSTASSSPDVYALAQAEHLTATTGGYLMWHVAVGDTVEIGQAYATYYQPDTNKQVPAVATQKFKIISTYGTYAIAEGEPIAWCVLV